MKAHLRSVALVGALAMILAACGGGEAAIAPDDSPATSTAPGAAPAPSPSPSSGAASPAPSDPGAGAQSPADPDAALAPDFTLPLGEGGEFALSEEALPVYMVFWAEW
ncbi:MAG: hypothetical protein ACFCVC_06130 [Acidimicrobiia bacterium]